MEESGRYRISQEVAEMLEERKINKPVTTGKVMVLHRTRIFGYEKSQPIFYSLSFHERGSNILNHHCYINCI